MRRTFLCIMITAFMTLAITQNALAVLVTFSGTVEDQGTLGGKFGTAPVLSGLYNYDPTTPDSYNDPAKENYEQYGVYEGAVTSLYITFGTYIAETVPPGNIYICNNSGIGDQYIVDQNLSGDFDGWKPTYFRFRLAQYEPFDMLNTDELQYPPNLTMAEIKEWELYFDREVGETAIVTGQLTSLKVVPEPTTMLLLGSGLVGLAGLRRRFKKI